MASNDGGESIRRRHGRAVQQDRWSAGLAGDPAGSSNDEEDVGHPVERGRRWPVRQVQHDAARRAQPHLEAAVCMYDALGFPCRARCVHDEEGVRGLNSLRRDKLPKSAHKRGVCEGLDAGGSALRHSFEQALVSLHEKGPAG
eukprot:scaffold156177_cov31-Tisochrysis_lutea.AAC.6